MVFFRLQQGAAPPMPPDSSQMFTESQPLGAPVKDKEPETAKDPSEMTPQEFEEYR